jgi:thiamine-monophosphate kinase
MGSREFERIRWLAGITARESSPGSGGRVLLGIGDDAAIWAPPRGEAVVLTVDVQVEGIHFRPGWLRPAEIGARAVASSASDLAAMAARPGAILLSIVLPRESGETFFRRLYRGALEEAGRSGLAVLGGNLSAGPLQVSVTAIGSLRPSEAVPRGGARPGDGIYVTGWPGRSRIGRGLLEAGAGAARAGSPAARRACLRAFRAPRARILEARWLARRVGPRSLVDLSDGLALDLSHILEMSPGLGAGREPGAALDRKALAALLEEDGCAALSRRLGIDPLEASLSGGEDYEILLTAPPERAERVRVEFRRRFGIPLSRLGTVVEGGGVRCSGREVREAGFDHFRPDGG